MVGCNALKQSFIGYAVKCATIQSLRWEVWERLVVCSNVGYMPDCRAMLLIKTALLVDVIRAKPIMLCCQLMPEGC